MRRSAKSTTVPRSGIQKTTVQVAAVPRKDARAAEDLTVVVVVAATEVAVVAIAVVAVAVVIVVVVATGQGAGASRGMDPEGADGFFWIQAEGETRLATENMVPGNQTYNEALVRKKGVEYRLWDPFKSKLAAAIMNGLDEFPFKIGSSVLYLGASTGTTVSHISDIVGPSGTVFAVDHASRTSRDLLDRVASYRRNVIPILQDARRPDGYFGVYGRIDTVYTDIAQPDQTEIAIANCDRFLRPGGHLFLTIKARSIDVTKSPGRVVTAETAKLDGRFEVIQTINLQPYSKDHGMVVARSVVGL